VKKKLIELEEKWLKILYETVEKEFNKHPLPSHDHTHHLRVWIFTKDFLLALHESGRIFSFSELEKIIIAVFFHDIGMVKTLNVSHGKESRRICEKFLNKEVSFEKKDRLEVLEAIEKHDDKTYLNHKEVNTYSVYTILSVCDDLDAYGAIGIYRYLEIYRMRGLNLEDIPSQVITNLQTRIGFLESHGNDFPGFIYKHRERQQITYRFYADLIGQIKEYGSTEIINGPIHIINIMINNIISLKRNIEDILEMKSNDNYTMQFFRQLKNEIESTKFSKPR